MEYKYEAFDVRIEQPDLKSEGSMAISYGDRNEPTEDEAYAQLLPVMKGLINMHYECLLQDEGGVLVLSYCYDKWKAQEFGCASFHPIDNENYRAIVEGHEDFEYTKERDERGDIPADEEEDTGYEN
jgi:hypothetical protein